MKNIKTKIKEVDAMCLCGHVFRNHAKGSAKCLRWDCRCERFQLSGVVGRKV